jgi:hypothetical protein
MRRGPGALIKLKAIMMMTTTTMMMMMMMMLERSLTWCP